MLAGSRDIRDFVGVMPSVVQRHRLTEDLWWNDFGISSDEVLTACETITFTEGEASDTGLLVSRVREAQARIQAKKNRHGLELFPLAVNDVGGMGKTLRLEKIFTTTVEMHTNEYAFAVLHPYAAFAIDRKPRKGYYALCQEQMIPPGIKDRSFMRHYRGEFLGVQVFEHPHLALDSNGDVTNGIFSRSGITLVEAMHPKIQIEGDGAGGVRVQMCDEYAYNERSSSNLLAGYTTDATEPS